MSQNFSDNFYWNDWERDEGLKLVSYAAQGFWMRCLCIAARANPRGYLKYNGIALSPRDLAKMLPGLTEQEAETYMHELVTAGVVSVTATGVVYNRRMARSARVSQVNSKNGKKGGLVSRDKKRGIHGRSGIATGDPPGGGAGPTKTAKTSSSTHSLSPQSGACEKSARADLAERAAACIGVRQLGDLNPGLAGGIMPMLESAIAQGCDWTADIAPALAAKPGGAMPSKANYWLTIATSNRDKRLASPAMAITTAHRVVHQADATKRLRAWLERGDWLPSWGPNPDEAGCWIPPELIESERTMRVKSVSSGKCG